MPAAMLLGLGPPPPLARPPHRRLPGLIATGGALVADVVEQAVVGHRHEQLEQLLGLLQVELAGHHTDEEVGEDRLANVHRVQDLTQARVGQANADVTADRRLVVATDGRPRRRRRRGPAAVTAKTRRSP